jgi:hypothetical protein
MNDPVWLLAFNGALQVFVSSLLGSFMLIPMQPWGRALAEKVDMRSLLSAHLDWYMLAFMQWGACLIMQRWPQTQSLTVAWFLVFGGWTNALPYLLRGVGINAFAFAGDAKQRVSALISGASALSILIAWFLVLRSLLQPT